jgi:uncharacterized membrane protein
MAESKSSRLAYIDWMRGLACVLMFQTHCYDAWLAPAAKKSSFFMWSQLLGTLPAPLFLFLAGVSVALVIGKMQAARASARQVALAIIHRGAEILGLGLLFRLQEYVIAFPWAPWTDLLRVDILNTIGVSIMLMGGLYWSMRSVFRKREVNGWPWLLASAAFLSSATISLLTPILWTTWRPHWLPWPIESYIDGVHNSGTPQSFLFPIFPWTGFAFAGLACGLILFSVGARNRQGVSFALAGLAGTMMIAGGKWLDSQPQLYPISDFWRTSPNFFLMRVGILLLILAAVYGWCRWAWGRRGFSPLAQLGQTSLLVYWVHIEFVYGRVSILKKHAMGTVGASLGLVIIFIAMLMLSVIRTRLKRTPIKLSWVPSPLRTRTQKAGQ